MNQDPVKWNNLAVEFAQKMSGGAFICKGTPDNTIIFANRRLIELFECSSYEEFIEHVGGSMKGFLSENYEDALVKDAQFQIINEPDPEHNTPYSFFSIRTRTGKSIRVVDHWRFEKNDEGGLIYGMIFPHNPDNLGTDYDPVTGLFGKRRFRLYIDQELTGADHKNTRYAIIYINIVNFKLLNVENGIAEGDRCLKILSNILTGVFKDHYLSRLSDDHFAVFGQYDNIFSKAEEAESEFKDAYGRFFNVFVKLGIYSFTYSEGFDPEDALSRAKIACDYIKRDLSSSIVEYTDDIEERIKTRDYIVRNLDEALEKEWIKIYFQPVIRSLTEEMCCMESLVRWIDPVIGFLPPNRFISVLEDERLIHKLDSYVVERVCRYIRERINAGLPMVPVSVNFSQMDFVMSDMLQVVESAVEKYNVPRDYIHIEITESMIASDEEMMHVMVNEFQTAGFEVWMDDFGSGYSSLTVLKDYSFNTLKMDMRFLSPFTEKSKSIMRSVVTMAKNIGMKTLAEGVETKEQLDFLKSIGCGFIQGYYYGKPEPVEAVFEHIFDKNIRIENRKWRGFYETAGFNVKYTDNPLEIIEDDGRNFKTLFMNDAYRRQIGLTDCTYAELDEKIYHTGSPLLEKYRAFAKQIEKSGQEETFYYTSNGTYLRFTGKAIAECDGHYIIKGMIVNISNDQARNDTKRLDNMARQLNLLFETVLLVKLAENTVTPLFGGFRYLKADINKEYDLQKGIRVIADYVVHHDESERCHAFLLSADLKYRVESTGKGYITDIFKTKQEDGSYAYKEYFIMMIPGTDGNEYLYCMKDYKMIKDE